MRRQARIIQTLRRNGVRFDDPGSCKLDASVRIGRGTVIKPFVVLSPGVVIGENCQIGPFAYLRPGTVVGSGVKIGDFVETKNCTIGDGTFVSHLTYVGDADIGADVNLGCGVVTVNYDGREKARTVVGDGAFIGCNCNLIAPVTVHEHAYTAAGSTITEDVPAYALGLGRARQLNKPGWVKRR
jgi:bifunctional UDP-N-acetylglucosamine pyrophosphorylase/glucosamine-1-phosphate N-acetyltransferase